eukprot:5650248-Pyramimonas_sp.AAC.1
MAAVLGLAFYQYVADSVLELGGVPEEPYVAAVFVMQKAERVSLVAAWEDREEVSWQGPGPVSRWGCYHQV